MKRLKLVLLGALLTIGSTAMAESYNRVGLTYNLGHYNFNKDYEKATIMAGFDDFTGFCTNGFGLNYVHGFGLSSTLPMFLEVGGELNFNFAKKGLDYIYDGYYGRDNIGVDMLFQDINLNIPINFTWQFDINDDIKIAPYTGFSFKIHMMTREKAKAAGESSDWISVYDDGKDAMGDKNATWNRFQMAWQLGGNVIYQNKYTAGLEYGYDMIPAYSHNFKSEAYNPRVTNGTFKITLGYIF